MGIVFGRTGVLEPPYEVLLSRNTGANIMNYEVRKYGKRFAIETSCASDEDSGKSFMKLAKYIGVSSAPQNDGGVPISMTAPVVTDMNTVEGKTIAMTAPVVMSSSMMQFILPAEFDQVSKIPKPLNSDVHVVEVPPAVGAVYKFSGWVKREEGAEKVKQLTKQLNEDGVNIGEDEAKKKSLLWQFHPPFTLPFLRRNEVWIELTEAQIKKLVSKFSK